MRHVPVRMRSDRLSAARGVTQSRPEPDEMVGPVGPTPGEVVYSENKLELVHYEPTTEEEHDVPILLVYAIINRPTILDFQPEQSVIRQFLDHGFHVYLLDWGVPSRLDATLDLSDYVTRYLANCVNEIGDRSGVDDPHLFGYCTGATLSVIFASLFPDRVRSLGMLAAILNFDAEGGIFRLWGQEGYYDPEELIDTFGNAPGDWLGFEFALIDPVEYYLARYLRLASHVYDEEYVSHFIRRVRWGYETVDVPGELYREFLVDLYRENRLMEGRLSVDGRTVDLANITMPVLNVIGTEDQFIPAQASLPFVEAIPSSDTETIEFPTDHVGLSIDDRAHEELWPRVCKWFVAHSKVGTTGP